MTYITQRAPWWKRLACWWRGHEDSTLREFWSGRSLTAALVQCARCGRANVVSDMVIWCSGCQRDLPHRWRPSPDAGPFWRCCECGGTSP